jgi:hypothetical protein
MTQSSGTTPTCCDVVELRRYTLHPGKRDTLIDLFDAQFVEPQEELGTHVVGQFRDRGADDVFVWFRGFTSMGERRRCLEEFYGGPVWKEHREAANATMIDSDDVHLLAPLHRGPGWPAMGGPRVGSEAVFELTTLPRAEGEAAFAALEVEPVAAFATLHEVNDFPALPVRDDDVLVWLLRFDDERAYDEHRRTREAPVGATVHVLRPTSRSQLS